MKKFALIAVSFFAVAMVQAQANTEIAIIPIPVSLERNTGNFTLSAQTRIEADKNPDVQRVVNMFTSQVSKATGFPPAVDPLSPAAKPNIISFSLNTTANTRLGDEGYTLEVTPTAIKAKANRSAGLFYAMQTIVQLFPKEIESPTLVKRT